jgi:peptidyl-prolyl cis-trans isomerase B (cyclophilin B)
MPAESEENNIATAESTRESGLESDLSTVESFVIASGSAGGDQMQGSASRDNIQGNSGEDYLRGMEGGDRVFGGADADILNGNQGDDTVIGAEGNDIIRGGKNHDSLIGGNGDDVLVGDFGTDTLTGGPGADTFVMRTATAVRDPLQADAIADFNPAAGDKIGLTQGVSAENVAFEALDSNNDGIADATALKLNDNAYLGVVLNTVDVGGNTTLNPADFTPVSEDILAMG